MTSFSLLLHFVFVTTAFTEATSPKRTWGLVEGIGLIGSVLSNKNPASTLPIIRYYAESLCMARGNTSEETRQILQDELNIDPKLDHLSPAGNEKILTLIKKAEAIFKKAMDFNIERLNIRNAFTDEVRIWINKNLYFILKDAQTAVNAVLEIQNERTLKDIKDRMDNIYIKHIIKNFGDIYNEGLTIWQNHALTFDMKFIFKDFEPVSSFLQHAHELMFLMDVFYESFAFKGNGTMVEQAIHRHEIAVNQMKMLKLKMMPQIASSDFHFFATNRTAYFFENGASLKTIYDKIAVHYWNDGSFVNNYYLLKISGKALIKKIDEFTFVKTIGNYTIVLHRRSGGLADDPKFSDTREWSNWVSKEMQTLEFAVRDALSNVHTAGLSLDELQVRTHEAAVNTCKQCLAVITSRANATTFRSDEIEPSHTGRIIKIFGEFIVFLGF